MQGREEVLRRGLCVTMGIPKSHWCWGSLGGWGGAGGRWDPSISTGGLRNNPSSGLCLSSCACRMAAPPWKCPHGPECWNWPPLCPPKSLMEELGLLFWKLSKEDLDALLSLKNWWENRCQNPGVDLINLPASKKLKKVGKDKCLFSWLTLADITPVPKYFFSLCLFVFTYSKMKGGNGEKKPM